MSRLTYDQLDYARTVFRLGQHCPATTCKCAACTAAFTLNSYERMLSLVEVVERSPSFKIDSDVLISAMGHVLDASEIGGPTSEPVRMETNVEVKLPENMLRKDVNGSR